MTICEKGRKRKKSVGGEEFYSFIGCSLVRHVTHNFMSSLGSILVATDIDLPLKKPHSTLISSF